MELPMVKRGLKMINPCRFLLNSILKFPVMVQKQSFLRTREKIGTCDYYINLVLKKVN